MCKHCLGALVVLCLVRTTVAADKPFPESMVTLRAQPSVFIVRAIGDVELTTPQTVSVNLGALKADLGKVQGVPVGQADSNRYWTLIGRDPEQYLVASETQRKWTFEDSFASRGSAFAVSREGILLTNAHVVSSKSEQPVDKETWGILQAPILEDVAELEKSLGHPTLTPEETQRVTLALVNWRASRSRFSTNFKSARVVLSYKVDFQKQAEVLKKHSLTEAIALKPEEISVPATILAIGESLPGKDIAVLRAGFEPEEQKRLLRLNAERKLPGLQEMLAQIQNDRMICLPLGNSEDVLPQSKIQALGFPGIAFNEYSMDEEALYKVSSRGGQISQTKRMLGGGGWDAFEVNTSTTHGDSGGPVLDMQGRVIGLNVGAATESPNALRLVVPINLARQMLAKAGIKPDPGRLSEHWEQALRLFAEGNYAAAEQEIQAAKKLQQGNSVLSGREVSWYLRDMHGRCLQKLGKIPGGN